METRETLMPTTRLMFSSRERPFIPKLVGRNSFQLKKKHQPRRFLLHFLILSNIAIQRPHVAPQDNLLLLVG
jgi:hypothetical protein